MNKLLSLYSWIKESTLRTTAGLFVLAALAATGIGITHAATSYDVAQETRMYLAVSITNTQTTGIIIDTPQLNNSTFTFSTTSGGVLRFNYGSHQEDVYYSSATLNAAKQVTLAGVIRNVCPQYFRTIVTCGNGQYFGKGTIVQLIQDARLFNLKANIDRANQFTSSGAVTFNGSGSLAFPTFSTTALRDQELGASPAGSIRGACVTATGLCYLSTGGVWTTIGNTGVGNASQIAAGIVQLGSLADQSGATILGSTGAPTVVQTRYLTGTGGTTQLWKIPYITRIGTLTGSVLGTGNQYASGHTHLSGTGGWVADSKATGTVTMLTGSILDSNTITNSQSAVYFTQTGTLLSQYINTAGRTNVITAAGTSTWAAGNMTVTLKLGSTVIATCGFLPVATEAWTVNFMVTTRVAGASGKLQTNAAGSIGVSGAGNSGTTGCGGSTLTSSFDTTGNQKVNIGVQWSSSNGTNGATMQQFYIDTRTP